MKKIVLLLIIVAMAASMIIGVSCKGQTVETTAAQTTAAAETTQAAETTEAAKELKPLKIGFAVTYGTHPSVSVIIAAAKAEFASDEWKQKGYDVQVVFTDAGMDDPTKIVNGLEDIYAQKPDGLLIFPAAIGESAVSIIKEDYNKNNIPVAFCDQMAMKGKIDYLVVVSSDQYGGGKLAGEYTSKIIPKGSKVAAITTLGYTLGEKINRFDGYLDVTKEAGMTNLPLINADNATLDVGKKLMEDLLVSDPDVKGVFTSNMLLTQGNYQAVKDRDLSGDVVLTTFDIDKTTYEMIKSGEIGGAVVQDLAAWGRESAKYLLNNIISGEKPPQQDVLITPKICTTENYQEFADDPQTKL